MKNKELKTKRFIKYIILYNYMANSRSVYLTDEQIEKIQELRLSPQEVFRQGFIIETLLGGVNPQFNNKVQKKKIELLTEWHASQIIELVKTINYHMDQIIKLNGGKNVSNKKTKNN